MKITKELISQVDRWIEEHKTQFVEEICQLIRYPSIADANSAVRPFGAACRDVLDAYLEIGKKHGFSVDNHDYYVGELYLPQWEHKSHRIGLLGHLDVVPVGEGWIYPPFEGIVKDGLIIGRGSQDNKGPCLTALYTVMCLRDLAVPLEYDICALAGTDEESGMGDVLYYRDHCSLPDLILVTDSGFPICYGERGIVSGQLVSEKNLSDQILSISAGTAAGILPAYAEIRMKRSKNLLQKLQGIPTQAKDYGWKEEGEELIFWAAGIGGHLAFAKNARSAIPSLLHFLLDYDLFEYESDREIFSFAADVTGSSDGSALSIDCADEISGAMKFGCGVMKMEARHLQIGFSARCPLSADREEVLASIKKHSIEKGYEVKQPRILEANYFPKETPVVDTLSKVFQQVTGLDWEPQVFEAGTHARKLPNAVAFGPGGLAGTCTSGSDLLPEGHGGAHQPDECQSIEALCMALKIYILGVAALDGKPLGKEDRI